MSNSISRISEDLDDYDHFCQRWSINSRGYGIYNHYDEIFTKLEVRSIYEFNIKVDKLLKEGWDVPHIKDFYNID